MRIEIRDILGIHAAELAVGPGEVVEVVGPNAGGKTSIATACQALLAREPNPLHYTVAEIRQYVREGDGEGWATMTVGGEPAATWEPAQTDGAIGALTNAPSSHPMAVGLVDFTARMPAKTRAGLLQPVLLPDPATVLEQLREDLQPYLPERDLEGVIAEVGKRGWEAAATIYEDRMRRAKREWCDTTGRGRFGSKVASDWRPAGWTADHDRLTAEEADRQVEEARVERDELLREVVIGEAELLAAETARAQLPAVNEELAAVEVELESHRDAEATAKQAHGAAEAPIREKREALAALDAKGKALKAGMELGGPTHECPHCGRGLAVVFALTTSLLPEVRPWEPPDTAAIEADLAKLREARIDMTRDLEKAYNREVEARTALTAEHNARTECEQRVADTRARARQTQAAAAVKGIPDSFERRERRSFADERVTSAQKTALAVAAAKEAERQADSVEHYQTIARAIGPSGARAGLVDARLATLQAGLGVVCATAGWPLVSVTAGGRIGLGRWVPFSGGEHWITQAALQLTIGAMTQSAAVVLDRADLLHGEWRAGLVPAVQRVASKTGMSVIVCSAGEPAPDAPWRQVVVSGGRTVDPETGEAAG